MLPIIEELIFRLPLRISKINLVIPISLILFLFLYRINIYVAISLTIFLFVFLIFNISSESSILKRVNFFSTKYLYIIFYSQAIIFGLLHLMNYRLNYKYFYLFPFFVISLVFTGCFFGYIRVKYIFGIYVCIVSHIIANSIYCFLFSIR